MTLKHKANRTKQSEIMRNSAAMQPYYSYELTRSSMRDPSARIRRTAPSPGLTSGDGWDAPQV